MNLTLNLNQEIDILNQYKLTCNELMFIRVTLIFQDEGNEELFKNYYKAIKNTNINVRELLVSLQNKGVLLKSTKIPSEGQPLNPMTLEFNKNFLKNLYKSSFEMGKELFEAYPQFATINGAIVPLRSVSKKFDSLEDAYYRYGKCIRWSQEVHNHIIELLNWAKEHNILNCSLGSFIVNNGWLDLESMMNGEAGNVNYDAIREL